MTESKESKSEGISSIIRFLGEDGKEHIGQPSDDLKSAEILEGSIFEHKLSGKKVEVTKLLAPLQPAVILCIGLNYKPHAKESQMAIPKLPVLFMKNPSAATGPTDSIVIPAVAKDVPQIDYEGELAVVIGKRCKNVSEEDALSYVLGYTVANDVSARHWQLDKEHSGTQWIRGKSFDTFCPLGPKLVLASALGNPSGLQVTTTLNGKVMQDGNTSNMIFSVPRLISFLSQDTTLLPGTVILSGTPEGVGFARSPPVFMKHGDVVRVAIQRVGEITNTVQDA